MSFLPRNRDIVQGFKEYGLTMALIVVLLVSLFQIAGYLLKGNQGKDPACSLDDLRLGSYIMYKGKERMIDSLREFQYSGDVIFSLTKSDR